MKFKPLLNNNGKTLIELMTSVGIMLGLALTFGGIAGLIKLFIPGTLPSPQLGMLADRLSNQICQGQNGNTPLQECFIMPEKCKPLFKPKILSCFYDMKAGIPPVMSPEEEKYFIRITASCWNKKIETQLINNQKLLKPECAKLIQAANKPGK